MRLIIFYVSTLQVKIWFQNRRTKWKKIDNISNAEAAEHKTHGQTKDGSPKDEAQGKLRNYPPKQLNQSSNSSIESDTKSIISIAADSSSISAKSFEDIFQTNRLPLSPESQFQVQMDSAKDVLLNLSFNCKENA